MGRRLSRTVFALALAVTTLGLGGQAAVAQGMTGSGSTRVDYVPPGARAPLVIASVSEPATAPTYTGIPSPRDVISVTGAYPGNTPRELYCIVYGRAC